MPRMTITESWNDVEALMHHADNWAYANTDADMHTRAAYELWLATNYDGDSIDTPSHAVMWARFEATEKESN